ncbi:MAG: hypothetical protein HON96_14495, partial [Rhodospirillaceae bacterium]|nr:hypothetical protein [Rhodospirillaceae bacterium]
KFFIIDDRNEKVRLDLSYQNLGQKIAALKTSNPSTASGSKKMAQKKFENKSTPENSETVKRPHSGLPDEQLCKKAIDGYAIMWDRRFYRGHVTEAQRRGLSVDDCVAAINKATVDDGSVSNRLKALKKLEEGGLITKEEAAAKRQEILKKL